MKSPPAFRTIILVVFVIAAALFSFLPENIWPSLERAEMINTAQGPRLVDAPAAPPAVLGQPSCDGFDQSGQWFAALLYVGSYDDGDTYSTDCFFADKRIRVRVANINTADDECPVQDRLASERARELIGGHRPYTAQVHWLYIVDVDRYGRVVAHVALPDGQFIGQILLDERLAEPAPDGRMQPFSC